MRKITVLWIVCLISILSGCTKQETSVPQTTDVPAAETPSTKEKQTDVEVWDKSADISIEEKQAESIEIPQEIAEEQMLNVKTFQTDINHDGNIDCVCIYEQNMPEYGRVRKIRAYDYNAEQEIKLLDDGMELTAQQKNELADVIADWYENGFGKRARKNYTQEGFQNVLVSSIQYTVIDCNEKSMICMSFATEEMQQFAIEGFEGDKVQVLLYYSEGAFTVYDAWFEGKWRSAAHFSS